MEGKRRRDTLLPNFREERNSSRTPASCRSSYYLTTRALWSDAGKRNNQLERSKTALQSQYMKIASPSIFSEMPNRTLEAGMAAKRRMSIEYTFCHVFGCPPKDQWESLDVISEIMER